MRNLGFAEIGKIPMGFRQVRFSGIKFPYCQSCLGMTASRAGFEAALRFSSGGNVMLSHLPAIRDAVMAIRLVSLPLEVLPYSGLCMHHFKYFTSVVGLKAGKKARKEHRSTFPCEVAVRKVLSSCLSAIPRGLEVLHAGGGQRMQSSFRNILGCECGRAAGQCARLLGMLVVGVGVDMLHQTGRSIHCKELQVLRKLLWCGGGRRGCEGATRDSKSGAWS